MNEDNLRAASTRLVRAAAVATEAAPNEESLRHELENALETACRALGVPWTPYELDRTLFMDGKGVRFADVIHGGVIIEYEPPKSFRAREAGAQLAHARSQAEEYGELTSTEEGRPLAEYELVVWDGGSISFGRHVGASFDWDRLSPFDVDAARILLRKMAGRSAPLVSPSVLKSYVGLDSDVGRQLVPLLFQSIVEAERRSQSRGGGGGGKTYLLFREWRRIFGQAVGINTDRLEALIERQARAHDTDYRSNIPAYLFTLHTYLALVAKLVAALALPSASQNMVDRRVPLQQRIAELESGKLFLDSGVTNMLSGDFFSWPSEGAAWVRLEAGVHGLLEKLSDVSFDLSRKNPASVRDLFKGVYEVFVPRELRHALGEVYTPDWLASYVLERVGWRPEDDLLDPTCGTGTFILEALKRRLLAAGRETVGAAELLQGISGMDLNPLAVLATKASIVVTLSTRFDPSRPVTLPVYLADAINIATPDKLQIFHHSLQTELGPRRFSVPDKLVSSGNLFTVFQRLRDYILAGYDATAILNALGPELDDLNLNAAEQKAVSDTVATLHDLHARGWDGIWCAILADRFAAGAIHDVSHIIGNPPWVKWSHLPPEYAEFIKPLCQALNAFSEDRYVGGIESDISTIITMQAVTNWLRPGGTLAFLITATLFSNESSQGFRRMESNTGETLAGFQFVEDLKAIAPFDGVTNHPSLMVLREGTRTEYPIPYVVWSYRHGPKRISSRQEFEKVAHTTELLASPVPGTDAGPWLKGTRLEHDLWRDLFDAGADSAYQARKGITTDLNGVYFVRAGLVRGNRISVENDPSIGRTPGLPVVSQLIEPEHLFPLARGRGLRRFQATTDPEFKVIVPQRGMHGDPTLPHTAPSTHTYLSRFQHWLEQRGSYRRYQSRQPFWSTWSTGPYTFSAFKVLWKEMGGRNFCAAYVGSEMVGGYGPKVVVPDHKLYFVPVATEDEARYLTAILNARTISRAVSGYAAQLSLGVSVIEYLKIPIFDAADVVHTRLAELCGVATREGGDLTEVQEQELDRLAVQVVRG